MKVEDDLISIYLFQEYGDDKTNNCYLQVVLD